MRRFTQLSARLLATVGLTALMLLLHLPLAVGRDAAQRLLGVLLPQVVPGQLRVGRVETLNRHRIKLSGVYFSDLDRRPMLEDATLILRSPFDLLRSVLRGTPLPPVNLRAARLHVFSPTLTRLEPGAAAAPSTPAATLSLRIPSITLAFDEVVTDPGSLPLVGTNARVQASITLTPEGHLALDLASLDAALRVTPMGLERLHATGRLEIHPGEASPRVTLNASLLGADLSLALRASVDAQGVLSVRSERIEVSADFLDRLASRAPGESLNLSPAIDDLSLHGSLGAALALGGTLSAQSLRVPLEGALSVEGQSLTLNLHHADLHALGPELPETDIDGPLRLAHQVVAGASELTLDASAVIAHIEGVPVPPAIARLSIKGTTLTIRSVRAPSVGLEAHGTVDLATQTPQIVAHAELSTHSLQALPWVAGRATGALSLTADVRGVPEGLDATIALRAERLGVSGVRVARARAQGTARWAHQRVTLALAVQAEGLTRGASLGPVGLRGSVTGDPEGHMDVTLSARGDGLLRALGGPQSPRLTRVDLRAGIDRDRTGIRVQIAPTAVTLRGAQARAQGELRFTPRAELSGRLRLDLGASGGADLELGERRVRASLRALDLAWFNPVLQRSFALSGRASGTVTLGTGARGGAEGSLALRGFSLEGHGSLDTSLSLRPEGELSRAALSVQSTLGPRVEGGFRVRVPTLLGDVEGWFRGLRDGELSLEGLRTDSLRSFMPPLVIPTGALRARASFSRLGEGAPLTVVTEVEGSSLGAFVGSRRLSVVRPLRLRAQGRITLPRASLEASSLALRIEVGDEQRQSRRGRAADSELIADASILGMSAELRGPWLSAITLGGREIFARGHPRPRALTASTRAMLAEASTAVHLRVGPLLRSEWPLRGVAEVMLPLPSVPPSSSATLRVSIQGPLLALRSRAELEFSAPSFELAGIAEPVGVLGVLSVAPSPGQDLLGPLGVHIEAQAALSPDGAVAVRRTMAVDVILAASGAELLDRGALALTMPRFDIDSEAIALERFAIARERGVTGTARLELRATDDPSRPVSVRVNLEDLRVARRVEPGAQPANSLPLRATLVGAVLRDQDHWNLHTCLIAAARLEARAGGEALDCAPLGAPSSVGAATAAIPDTATTLHARALLPFVGNYGHWRFVTNQANASVRTTDFRIDPVSVFIPEGPLSFVGGLLSTDLRWQGSDPRALHGTLGLRDGRVELTSTGEPLRNLIARVTLDGHSANLASLEADVGRGQVSAHGSVEIASDRTTMALALEARQAPVTQEGNTFGWLDATAHLDLVAGRDGARCVVRVERAEMLLHDQTVRELQPTSLDPAFYVLGRADSLRAGQGPLGDYPLDFALSLDAPAWLRRDDFAVAVRGALTARVDRSGPSLVGTIERASTQSWFSLVGKRFDIERLSLQFDGGIGVNPVIDISAVHNAPSAGRITAVLGGRLLSPTLTLSAERYPGASQSEITAMLVVGRSDGPTDGPSLGLTERVTAAATSFLTGFVSTALSRESAFRLRPIVESNDTGGGRYGGGVSVSPRVYLEATYSSTSRALGQGAGSSTNNSELRTVGEYILSPALTLSNVFTWGSTGSYRWIADLFWSP